MADKAAGRPPGRAKAQGADWRLLSLTALLYGVLLATTLHFLAEVPEPLPADADATLFSEGRAFQHLDVLATKIGHRQVGTVGEEQAADYLYRQVQQLAEQAQASRADLTAEAARESVSGGVTMHAFKFEIANVYNNLTNVVLRLAPADPVAAAKKAVLVNSHYDSTLGTVGASDCGSTVAIILEMARTIIANPAIKLSAPVVFLLNGGEETLSQAANGFFASSRFASQLGAFINLESTGPWGPDVVFQHTGDWTLQAYARSAPRPRGTTMAQDFFDLGLIPADTDYRMFSYRHYGGLPGIDIAFIFDGTAYHTARDEPSRIRRGTLQGMGVNVLAAIQEYTRVLASDPAAPQASDVGGSVYFDFWGKFMVIYSHAQAKALHHAPLFIVLLLPLLAPNDGIHALSWGGLIGSALLALASVLCAVILPALLGAARCLAAGLPMPWYGRPEVAYAMFLPAATAGLLLPYVLAPPDAKPGSGSAGRRSLGTALLFALVCSALTSVGMHSSFFYALWAAGAALAAALLGTGARPPSIGGALALLACFAAPVAIMLPSSVTFMAHIMEKVGLAGEAPGVLALLNADLAVGAVAGATSILSFGTLTPHLAAALGRRGGRAAVAALLLASLGAAGWASVHHARPFSYDHPKRVLVQHIHKHGTDGSITESKLSVVGLDGYPLAPLLPKAFLQQPPAGFSTDEWEAFYPLNYLISTGVARPAPGPPEGEPIPTLRLLSRGAAPADAASVSKASGGVERLQLELDTGLPGAWGVMNFTGPMLDWSLSDKVADTELPQGGLSHMVRFAANRHARRYTFWLDVPAGSPPLAVRLFVKRVEESDAAAEALLSQLPDWVSPSAVVCYQSRWQF